MFVGEGNRLEIDVSEQLIHPQRTIIGSWVTSLPRMQELVGLLARWDLHPEQVVTDCFGLDAAGDAYATAEAAQGGKVAIIMES